MKVSLGTPVADSPPLADASFRSRSSWRAVLTSKVIPADRAPAGLDFVLQNGQRAGISFFSVHGHLPMGVALPVAR